MDWKEIKKNNPKVFKKLKWFYENIPIEINDDNRLGWYYTDGVHHVRMWTDIGNDMLYVFFDKQKIYITLKIVHKWDYTISDGKGHLLFTEYDYKSTRNESEIAAFTRAFETLENK